MSLREFVLGTAGHIDHGKTALVQALTGIDTDRLAEEHERGISIDIGFAHLELDSLRLAIIDVPGHERFIRNMLAGATGVDVAMLVVAADDGPMPQTREHLEILKLLGIAHGLIAITKADCVGEDWLELVEIDVRQLVAGTFLEHAPIIATSIVDGRGLDELRAAIHVVCAEATRHADVDAFRLAVDRSFVLQGLGTVVTGTVWSGRLEVGDEVAWLPAEKLVRVRGIQSHGRDVSAVVAGQRAAINLGDVHHSEIRRGHELATPGFLHPARCITVDLRVLRDAPWPVRNRAHVRLHVGTQEVIAGVRLIDGHEIAPGERAFAQLVCAEPAIAVGRQPFVIRAESPLCTLGGGIVLHPDEVWIGRRDESAQRFLPLLESADPEIRMEGALRFHPTDDGREIDLARAVAISESAVPAMLARLETSGRVIALKMGRQGRRHLHKEAFEELATRVHTAVERLHAATRIKPFVPRERVVARLDYLEPVVVRAVLDALIEREELVQHHSGVALAGHHPVLTHAQRHLRSDVLECIRRAAFQPPDPAKLAQDLGALEDDVRAILDLCVAEGHLVHVDGGLFLHQARMDELFSRLREALSLNEGLTVGEIKTVLETSRKYAVPICEYLDRIGFTERQGDTRVLAETDT